jgi:electron transfer flavoprotein beta subunit
MAAKKKPVEIKNLTSLGIEPSLVGTVGAWSVVDDATPRPPKAAGIKIVDDGNGGKALVDFLVEKKLI